MGGGGGAVLETCFEMQFRFLLTSIFCCSVETAMKVQYISYNIQYIMNWAVLSNEYSPVCIFLQ